MMNGTINYAKVMPIEDPVTNVGIENLYLTQVWGTFFLFSLIMSIHLAHARIECRRCQPTQLRKHGILFHISQVFIFLMPPF